MTTRARSRHENIAGHASHHARSAGIDEHIILSLLQERN
jgi:hypothetical protein